MKQLVAFAYELKFEGSASFDPQLLSSLPFHRDSINQPSCGNQDGKQPVRVSKSQPRTPWLWRASELIELPSNWLCDITWSSSRLCNFELESNNRETAQVFKDTTPVCQDAGGWFQRLHSQLLRITWAIRTLLQVWFVWMPSWTSKFTSWLFIVFKLNSRRIPV